jgi:signal transduction histidine kinase
VEIKREFPKEQLRVSVDPDQMRQAFTNLGVNALEAMPYGGVLKVTVLDKTKDRVLIQFSDTGKGIPQEVQAKVFDPFFTTKEGGTGLGLSIAHRIISQHGGEIRVEGEGGKGSSFMISLPLEKEQRR